MLKKIRISKALAGFDENVKKKKKRKRDIKTERERERKTERETCFNGGPAHSLIWDVG